MSHALLSPSSASRWIHCPPSALLNASAGDKDTVFTREGTLAHAVCELKARKQFVGGVGPKKFAKAMAEFKADELWQDEMDGYTDSYLAALKDFYAAFNSRPHVAVEQRVSFEEYVPEGFGTADCIMLADDALHVIDFKYGRGVPVSAEDNPQMKLYAVGALAAYEAFYDIRTVRMSIVQPRIRSEPDTWETTADDLRQWAEGVVKPAAALAAEGNGEFAEGDWCRWCAIRGSCRARAEAMLPLTDFMDKTPPVLLDEEIGLTLELGRRLKAWLSDLEDYALSVCLRGGEIEGYKAVEGRSTRAWTDQEQAFAAARKAGVPEAMLYERKPVSLAELEKVMGKQRFNETLSEYITTPPGKPTLVPASDRRRAITDRPTAEQDFGKDISQD